MVELDSFKTRLNGYTLPLEEVRESLDLENKEQRVEELEREMEAPGFWDNAERSQKMMKELSALKSDMEVYHKLQNQKEEIELMIDMGYEENDPSVIPDIEEMLKEFEEEFETIRIKTLLSGEYDKCSAIVTLHAGAGGNQALSGVAPHQASRFLIPVSHHRLHIAAVIHHHNGSAWFFSGGVGHTGAEVGVIQERCFQLGLHGVIAVGVNPVAAPGDHAQSFIAVVPIFFHQVFLHLANHLVGVPVVDAGGGSCA